MYAYTPTPFKAPEEACPLSPVLSWDVSPRTWVFSTQKTRRARRSHCHPESPSRLLWRTDCFQVGCLPDSLQHIVSWPVMEHLGSRKSQACSSLLGSFPQPPWVIQEMCAADREQLCIFSVVAFKQDIQHRTHKLYLSPFKVWSVNLLSSCSQLDHLG